MRLASKQFGLNLGQNFTCYYLSSPVITYASAVASCTPAVLQLCATYTSAIRQKLATFE